MTVSVYNPSVSLTLRKNIGRASAGGSVAASQRYTGTQRVVDLTPLLSDTGSIVVSKSCRETMGTFQIVLTAGFADGELETAYGLIEPLDIIEIRAARSTVATAGNSPYSLPLLMRGFVRVIASDESMTDAGPQRVVIIEGGDYGFILDIIRSNLYPGATEAKYIQNAFTFFSRWGNGADGSMDASSFVELCVNNIVSPFIATMQATGEASTIAATGNFAPSPVMQLTAQALVQGGTVFLTGIDARWSGNNLDGLLRSYGDVPEWNELFVQDFESGPYLIYRPAPLMNVDGQFINAPYTNGVAANADGIPIIPPTTTVLDTELVGRRVQRDDSKIFNFVWVDSEWLQATGQGAALQYGFATLSSENIVGNANSSPDFYGFRMLRCVSRQGPRFDNQKEAAYDAGRAIALAQVNAKVQQLILQNQDNIVFESGTMRIRGRPDVTAGSYVKLLRGLQNSGGKVSAGFTQTAYITRVVHEILPFRTWTSTLELERGTGFINRIARGNGTDAPALAEMSPGGVYGG
ncbi:MAG: hypothetical protein ACLQJR_05705 [Stellaceae bacterium]